MSALNSLHQANAQVLAQVDRLNQIAAEGQLKQVDQAVKIAELNATQKVEAVSNAAKEAALDTVV